MRRIQNQPSTVVNRTQTVRNPNSNVGPTAIKAVRAESFLLHKPLDAETIAEAARLAAADAEPVDDRRGTAEYKRDVVRVLAARALRLAAQRARGLNMPSRDRRA